MYSKIICVSVTEQAVKTGCQSTGVCEISPPKKKLAVYPKFTMPSDAM